ncbi:glycosyltransferase [Fulvivirga sediminis]|uniref:Glycosyltransferase n=1 Tax=Fulvivirga sediminis TaxID=2803949 RepID=A0A937K0J5_9BACT|nr:glycosyltransferase [Fulvivirga sediminis]MBL3655632.1 glycosyltransferase [Fulvivirga sediminis]
MILTIISLLFVTGAVLCVDLLLIILWKPEGNSLAKYVSKECPKVSVLVAARNEQATLERCINALLELEYPTTQLEIFIGNDHSTDSTLEIAQSYANKYEHISVVDIQGNLGHARGKANVLAHLANLASGDFLFITDADVAVPHGWIKGMLQGFKNNKVAIVTGVTGIENSFYQDTDWLFALGMVKVITDLGQPVTCMGNNMAISKEAYMSVGGYENIPFSITEDFELFKQVRKKKYDVVQLYRNDVFGLSLPAANIHQILNQRKRWMKGAVQLPFPIVSLLALQAIYYPAIVLLLCLVPLYGIILALLKIFLQSYFIRKAQITLHKKPINLKFIKYEAYSLLLSMASSIFYLLPIKTVWKGRKY